MLRDSARRRGHGSRMVAANIVKGAELAIRPADHDERLTRQIEGEELAGSGGLIGAPHRNPVAGENLLALQASDALINVPCSRNGVRLFERRLLIVEGQDIGERVVHSASLSRRAAMERCPRRYTAKPASSSTAVMTTILRKAVTGLGSSSAGNREKMMAAVVEKNPMQASGMATRLPPGRRSAPGGAGRDCRRIIAAKRKR